MKSKKKLLKLGGIVLAVIILLVLIICIGGKKTSVETIKLTYGSSTNVDNDYRNYHSKLSNYAMSSVDSAMSNGSGFDIEVSESFSDEAGINYSDSGNTAGGNSSLTSNKKLKKTYNYSVESNDYDNFIKEIETKVDTLGGYIESVDKVQRTEVNSTHTDTYTVRRATYQIRVPADKIENIFNVIEGKAYIVSQSEGVEDVTTQYIDLDTHIKSLTEEYNVLEELLASATSLSDVIEIQDRLSDINYEIESYTQTLDALKEDIDYCKLHLVVNEVIYYQDTVTRFTSDIAEEWSYIFEEWLVSGLLPILLVTISLIPLLIAVCIAVYIVSRIVLKNRMKYQQTVIVKSDIDLKDKEE